MPRIQLLPPTSCHLLVSWGRGAAVLGQSSLVPNRMPSSRQWILPHQKLWRVPVLGKFISLDPNILQWHCAAVTLHDWYSYLVHTVYGARVKEFDNCKLHANTTSRKTHTQDVILFTCPPAGNQSGGKIKIPTTISSHKTHWQNHQTEHLARLELFIVKRQISHCWRHTHNPNCNKTHHLQQRH